MFSSSSDAAQRTEGVADLAQQEMFNRIRRRAQAIHNLPREDFPEERVTPIPSEIGRARQLSSRPGYYEPYLEDARNISARSRIFPQAFREYMEPYTQEVVRKMGEEGMGNLRNNIAPLLSSVGSKIGQFGTENRGKIFQRSIADIQRNIESQKEKALLTGYGHAGELFNRDKANEIERANMLSRLAQTAQAGRESDIKALREAGDYKRMHEQMMRDVAYQEWVRKNNYEWDTLSKWIAAQQGLPLPMSRTDMGIQPLQPTLNSAGSAGVMGAHMLGAAMRPTVEQERLAILARARQDGFI